MEIHPQILAGNWKVGFALDLHTEASCPKERTTKIIQVQKFIGGQMVTVDKEVEDKVKHWETSYTPIGLELNHLKYWKQKFRAKKIAAVAASFLQSKMSEWQIQKIIPIPPSDNSRLFQPVYEMANHIGTICGLEIDFQILRKLKSTCQLKEIEDPAQRKEILKGMYSVAPDCLKEKNVLVFDDLYRSGETLKSATDVIINQGRAKAVYVLTITKTRSKR